MIFDDRRNLSSALDAYRLFLNRDARTIFDATDYGTFDLPDYELYYTRQPGLFDESSKRSHDFRFKNRETIDFQHNGEH